ncbi:MAG: SMP-30/gluconolactonase/LRE family protein, partial [Planctomycetota bacterium]
PESDTPTGTITDWEVSQTFPADRIDADTHPDSFMLFRTQWEKVESEPSGLVDISRYRTWAANEGDCVFGRTVIRTDRKRDIDFSFGYSDDVSIFLNGKKVFSGRSGYRSRDPSFAGIVGLNDTLRLTLPEGLSEIFLTITERFGGWGFMGKINRELEPPIKRHELLTKVWETPDVFKIPESVMYDPQRDILYVSSFDRLSQARAEMGFISRVKLNGEIADLNWVTGLDGPCGMGIYDNKLYVVEGFRGNLVEIDIDNGEILNRYPLPGHQFTNDVAIDALGNIYVSNTSRGPKALDIYKCKDGECVVWHKGDDLYRSNGLFIYKNQLLVGSTGDGLFRAVDLDDGRVTTITSLGMGIIDGIRVDNEGYYIVSHWEGETYRISPSGDIVEILDMPAGLNSADFEFIKEKSMLIIPTFYGNKVIAYELTAN